MRFNGPRRPAPSPVPEPADSDDEVDGAATVAANVVMGRQLAKRLDDFEAKYQASMAAHLAVMEAGKAVKDAVEAWRGVWARGE